MNLPSYPSSQRRRTNSAAVSSKSGSPSRHPVLWYMLAVATYAFVFTFSQAQPVPLDVHAAAVLLTATCLIPITLWYARGSKGIPMFELICLAYAVQFSMPVYTQPNELFLMGKTQFLFWDSTFQTLLLVEAGVVALMTGYYWVHHSNFARTLPKSDLPLASSKQRTFYVIAIAMGGTLTLLSAMNWQPLQAATLGAVVRALSNQFSLGFIILAYEVYRSIRPRRALSAMLYLSVVVSFLAGLLTGMLENALIPLVYLAIIRWHVRRKLPWAWLLLGVVLFVILNPAKFEYRRLVWQGYQNYNASQRIEVWTEAVRKNSLPSERANSSSGALGVLNQSLARFDLLHKFIWVRELTPSVIPYYSGETYRYFLVAWIPRIVWPDKPSASQANNRTDVDYGFLYEQQTTVTNVGIGHLPEAYANFGILGILLVLGLQGVLFALLDSVLNGPNSQGGRAIYLSMMVFFLNGIGSSAVILFGALLQQLLANILILRLFAEGFSSKNSTIAPSQKPVLPLTNGRSPHQPSL